MYFVIRSTQSCLYFLFPDIKPNMVVTIPSAIEHTLKITYEPDEPEVFIIPRNTTTSPSIVMEGIRFITILFSGFFGISGASKISILSSGSCFLILVFRLNNGYFNPFTRCLISCTGIFFTCSPA